MSNVRATWGSARVQTIDDLRSHCSIDDAGCWNWLHCSQANGYGRIRRDGRTWYVHRLAYFLVNGPVPEGLDVCHSCDNRRCGNPEHLFSGTRKDNMTDAKNKGRTARGEILAVRKRGELTALARLTTDDVLRIRSSSDTPKILATIFGVSVSNIHCILRRRTWRHV